MRIRKRIVTTSNSIEQAMRTLKSAAYRFPEGKFDKTSFSFYCARRHGGRTMTLIPVRGSIFLENDQANVLLEIHADLTFYIGWIISLLGTLGAVYMLILQLPKWYTCCMAIPFGAIVSCTSLLAASEILDRLEFKLCRSTGE